MGALRLDSARPFDSEIEVHCAKYFKITFATLRSLEFIFSINSSKLLEPKNPQPVESARAPLQTGPVVVATTGRRARIPFGNQNA